MIPVAGLQRSPAAIPHSASLCVLALAWIGLLSAIYASIMSYNGVNYALGLAASIAFSMVVIYAILRVTKKPDRYLQTITASFGAGAVLLLVQIALAFLLVAGISPRVAAWLFLLILAWSLLIDGFILSKSLEIDMMPASVMALVIMVMQMAVLQALPELR